MGDLHVALRLPRGKVWREEEMCALVQTHKTKMALAFALQGLVIIVGDESHNGKFMATQGHLRFKTKSAMLCTAVHDPEYHVPDILQLIDVLQAPLSNFPLPVWDIAAPRPTACLGFPVP